MPKRIPLTVDEIKSNLRAIRAQATPAQVQAGIDWYPGAQVLAANLMDEAFDATGEHPPMSLTVGALAAYSMNSTWAANVTITRNYLCGRGLRGLPRVCAEIESMEAGTDPTEAMCHLKRPDFYRNIMGDLNPVTCDRWHLRAAFNLATIDPSNGEYPEYAGLLPLRNAPAQVKRARDKKTKRWYASVELTAKVHADVTRATQELAAEFGEQPAETQAIIWCVIRGSGE